MASPTPHRHSILPFKPQPRTAGKCHMAHGSLSIAPTDSWHKPDIQHPPHHTDSPNRLKHRPSQRGLTNSSLHGIRGTAGGGGHRPSLFSYRTALTPPTPQKHLRGLQPGSPSWTQPLTHQTFTTLPHHTVPYPNDKTTLHKTSSSNHGRLLASLKTLWEGGGGGKNKAQHNAQGDRGTHGT